MIRSPKVWWSLYGGCVLLVVLALSWMSATVLDLERKEKEARARADVQTAAGYALYRLDFWMNPFILEEAARPYFEYLPFYPQRRSYSNFFNDLEVGDVMMPSPLLTLQSEFVRLHFQLDNLGNLTSPRVPKDHMRDGAIEGCVDASKVEQGGAELAAIAPFLQFEDLWRRAGEQESQETLTSKEVVEPISSYVFGKSLEDLAKNEYQKRSKSSFDVKKSAQINAQSQVNFWNASLLPEALTVGTLVPLWLEHASEPDRAELFLVRQVQAGDHRVLQGICLRWPRLRELLLEEIEDLLPGARLEPIERGDESGDSLKLATLPVKLVAGTAAAMDARFLTPIRGTLLLNWAAVLVAVAVVGVTLRATIAFGEKRHNFASAVTHELRTPLTTFRMYSEMLADGMVTDEAARRHYLGTLKEESGRLATLVENVLSYSRLEKGQASPHHEVLSLAALWERLLPSLQRRAEAASMKLVTTLSDARDRLVRVDVEVVGQILFNLVDNACKYGRSLERPEIEIQHRCRNNRLEVSVRDHGPGVPGHLTRQIFRPFERAGKNHESIPGIGIGLTLARGLARTLGGDLTLDAAITDGAQFQLTLPVE